jgi:tetratricopeptide (TPR) repeat protein
METTGVASKAGSGPENPIVKRIAYELPHLTVGQAYEQKGDSAQAIPELRKAVDLSHGTPLMVSALAHAYGCSGNRVEAEKLLAQLKTKSTTQYVSPYYFAIVSVGLGKNEEALDLLEKAFGDRSNGLVFFFRSSRNSTNCVPMHVLLPSNIDSDFQRFAETKAHAGLSMRSLSVEVSVAPCKSAS